MGVIFEKGYLVTHKKPKRLVKATDIVGLLLEEKVPSICEADEV